MRCLGLGREIRALLASPKPRTGQTGPLLPALFQACSCSSSELVARAVPSQNLASWPCFFWLRCRPETDLFCVLCRRNSLEKAAVVKEGKQVAAPAGPAVASLTLPLPSRSVLSASNGRVSAAALPGLRAGSPAVPPLPCSALGFSLLGGSRGKPQQRVGG